MPAPRPNPWIETLAPYVPGRSKAAPGRRVAKLSANESPFGASPRAIAAFREAGETLHLYPDGDSTGLRDAIGEVHGLPPARIVCGAGSDELIHLAIQAFAQPGDEVIHSRYGFMMYPIAARGVGAVPVAVDNRDWAADIDGILAAVTPRTRLVCLDNPNNPTGAFNDRGEIERLLAGLPESCVLVYDTAYAECVDAPDYEDGIALAAAHDNVLMLRTLSKVYGLAALRIGWGHGSMALIDPINRIRGPFNVARPTQAAAIAAVRDREHLAHARAGTIRLRQWFARELAGLGLETVPSQTNFILVRFSGEDGKTAEAANAFLTDRGYLLRWLPGQGLADCLRLSFGTEEENRGLIAALAEFLGRASGASAAE